MSDIIAYKNFYNEIIDKINSRRYKAYKSLNKHHIEHNFELGEIIVKHQEKQNWGQSIVEKLSKDITKQIDAISGYSPQNLWRMRQSILNIKTTLVY
jgi:hypothetical protein